MNGNRTCALALSAAFALLAFAPAATAASFDGSWNMLVQTTSGHCGRIKVGLGNSRGHIVSTSGSFALHPIVLTGHVYGSGHTLMKAVAGPRVAEGAGQFMRSKGTGRWKGTGPSGVCSGFWTAIRS